MGQSQSSFGIELEFLVALKLDDTPLIIPERFQSSPGAPIWAPGLTETREFEIAAQKRLEQTIRKAIGLHHGPRVRPDSNTNHLTAYQNWVVDREVSVHVDPATIEQEHGMGSVHWQSVEVISPAMWASESAWDEVFRVVEAISEDYWIWTPASAGMHVHYGNGRDYIPVSKLRRIAAFLFSADPLLVSLYPEHRRANTHCLSNRLYSVVAHGTTATTIARLLGFPEFEENSENPQGPIRQIPPSSDRRRNHQFRRAYPRGSLTGYPFQVEYFTETEMNYEQRGDNNTTPYDITFGIDQILKTLDCPTTAELMSVLQADHDRPAYSFRSYRAHRYKQEPLPFAQLLKTIEFRQMPATIDAREVVAHAKIVVGMCEWASTTQLATLWRVAFDCAEAERRGDWYDVFDLLIDLNLEEEAKVLQRTVAKWRGDPVPDDLDDEGDDDSELDPSTG
ncbi:putative amidoligase enzyme-domain-containing protein [Xylariaceae sp. FL1272]|nr:putative amidoligase enzyme-domain-containing protein [Xylariaceae sp. FL1272]